MLTFTKRSQHFIYYMEIKNEIQHTQHMAQKTKAIIHPYWLFWQFLLTTFLRLSQKTSLDCFSPPADGEPFIWTVPLLFYRLWRGSISFLLHCMQTYQSTELGGITIVYNGPISNHTTGNSYIFTVWQLCTQSGDWKMDARLGKAVWERTGRTFTWTASASLNWSPSWKRTSYRPELLFWQMRCGSWPELLCPSWNEEMWMGRL